MFLSFPASLPGGRQENSTHTSSAHARIQLNLAQIISYHHVSQRSSSLKSSAAARKRVNLPWSAFSVVDALVFLLCFPLFLSSLFFSSLAGLCLPSSFPTWSRWFSSAMFPPLRFFSSLLFFSGHFELRIRPSYHHTIIPSFPCVSVPGPAECSKRFIKQNK